MGFRVSLDMVGSIPKFVYKIRVVLHQGQRQHRIVLKNGALSKLRYLPTNRLADYARKQQYCTLHYVLS